MGADLLLSICPAPRTADNELVQDMDLIRRVAWERFAAVPKTHIADIAESWHPGWDDDEIEDLRDWAWGRVDEMITAYEKNYRDVTIIWPEGVPYLASGGMSWGDDPCESWEPIGFTGGLGIFKEPIDG